MMARDCFVGFRREEDIARVAGDVRRRLNYDSVSQFNIVDAVRGFDGQKFGKTDRFHLEVFDNLRPLGFAYVTFDPLVVHIEAETWRHASMGDPHSRHIIAHEIGHAILHDKTAKMFSQKENQFNMFGADEHSGEWQAEMFASHLLIPDSMALLFNSVQPLALHAGTPLKYASERLGDARRRQMRTAPSSVSGTESCIDCGNLSVVTTGLISYCEFCGSKKLL